MLFNQGAVVAVWLLQMLIGCAYCKPQVSTSSFSDAAFLDLLEGDCQDVLATASCLDTKSKNLCDLIGPSSCKSTCGLCPKPKCEDQLSTASCLDSKANGLCPLIGSQACKKTCGLCPASSNNEEKQGFEHLIADKITDNSSPLEEMGGTASLHTSSTDLSTKTYRCAGVLLSERYLISAAHCIRRTGKERLTTISLGRENLEDNPLPHQVYQINQRYIHPEYDPNVHDYNDIGIIMSERRIEFSKTIWAFCMPARNLELQDFTAVQIAGWGRINQTHTSQTLRTKFVKIVKNTRCVTLWQALDFGYYQDTVLRNYPQGLNERILCGQRGGVSSCEGDSGGPMVFENINGNTLIGLVSKGISCPRTPVAPVFYTNLAFYVDWILETMKGAQPLGPVNCGGPVLSSPAPVTCATLNCQFNEQCLEGSGSTPARCQQCRSGFGLSGGSCLETCGLSTSIDERIGGGISKRVVGGEEAIAGKYPWMVNLSFYSSFFEDNLHCAGTLVHKRWVLLPAHCISGKLRKNIPVYVRLGYTNRRLRETGSELFSLYLEDIITHSEFSASTLDNDISLARLPQDVTFSNVIQPICLGSDMQIPFDGKAYTAGWGVINPSDTETPDILHEVQLDVLAENSCEKSNIHICTHTPGKDTCKGDGGAPLMVQQGNQWFVIGISSHGPSQCAHSELPGVWTRIPNYLAFINSIINI